MAGRIYASRTDMTTEDPWAGARTAARDDVKTALARGTRLCPACGHEQESSGRFCDACGADLTARYRKPPQAGARRRIVVLGLALFAARGLPPGRTCCATTPRTERERTAQRQAALKARGDQAASPADSKPVRAEGLPRPRRRRPRRLPRRSRSPTRRRRITADGQARAAAGRLDGDIKGTECSPYPRTAARRAIEADPQAERGRYNCVGLHAHVRRARTRRARSARGSSASPTGS